MAQPRTGKNPGLAGTELAWDGSARVERFDEDHG